MPLIAYLVKLTPAQVDQAGRIVRVRWTLIDADDVTKATGTAPTADEAETAAIDAGIAIATAADAAELNAERAARAAIDKARGAP